ncbi:SDR family NAD(P)-dependent oxidoreductase [Lysobacter sp. A3-1-A15]|uniref:SDR family NAD(P)-dependent oxidoreductase n=1 Tax=Novilysobacter viscosus TaxID=3098602 RepID=UPI002ED7A393
MNRVQDKSCIVTGGAVGIGKACVEKLAQEGARVAIVDVQDGPGESLAAQLVARGMTARYWHVDVGDEAQVERAWSGIAEALGGIDVVVNNAGVAGANKPTDQVTEAEWDHVQRINVKGVFFCTKHAIAHLRRAGGGSIVNLSSIYGLVGAPDLPPYHASKGAVRLMTKTDALLFAPDGIRVSSIHPGFIWTPLVEQHLRDSGQADMEQGKSDLAQLHPLGRVGDPDDIAWGVVYLASDESRFVTGSELVIDGGYTAR